MRFPIRRILAGAVLFGLGAGLEAAAQGYPPPPPPQQGYPQSYPPGQSPQGGVATNPMCQRLEAQLASVDRGGGGDPAKAEQVRRFEDAAARQQGELDRVTTQAKRMGCDSSGFFSLFNNQSAQCGPINNQIQQMRGNLDQITNNLERLRMGGAGTSDRDNQRRSVLLALAQNNCGPQYVAAARNGGGNFLDNLFGNNNNPGGNDNPGAAPGPAEAGPPSGTYRTVCVRSCDGFYFPISFATVPGRFPDDEKTCKNQCPAAEATLFTYRNPGEDMNQAVSINGQPYSSSPNAFRYRQEFNPSCACKAAGQTWSEALKGIDDKGSVEQGDIIVTEERAKKMSQPLAKPAAASKKGAAPAAAAAPTEAPAADAGAETGKIRSVGPTFIPAR
ncbi:hypothetical protein HNR60_003861 [Rhodopseudomonas rhenobacensis]|uniref:DUF2865 domain-containing protein n=2 Tax=Rhodopseudomonas rhenobacensis TaxID=87461 RepID=A0A7W7Z6T9_9BRAD|nr:hypothetical protein [Rhodopseudomonas rhenobacensis]